MPLTELPFGLPGRLFRSPMPFGPYDLHDEVYDQFREEQIAVVVLLADDHECLQKAGRNLRALYLDAGMQVLYLPIPDFGVPTKDDLEQTVQNTIAYAWLIDKTQVLYFSSRFLILKNKTSLAAVVCRITFRFSDR